MKGGGAMGKFWEDWVCGHDEAATRRRFEEAAERLLKAGYYGEALGGLDVSRRGHDEATRRRRAEEVAKRSRKAGVLGGSASEECEHRAKIIRWRG